MFRRRTNMPVSILQVAKTIGELSGWTKSNLELQKIAYVAEMIHLGRTGQPLTTSDFQAWDRGPVNPELYQWAKMYGASAVQPDMFVRVRGLPQESEEFRATRDAYEAMKGLSPWQMVNSTHQADGAWASCYQPGRRGIVIPKDRIAAEYNVRITEDH
jgi:uncharacterized phage-associated protein